MIQWDIIGIYPLVNIQKAIENDHLKGIFPLKIVIFHSYVAVYQRVVIISGMRRSINGVTY